MTDPTELDEIARLRAALAEARRDRDAWRQNWEDSDARRITVTNERNDLIAEAIRHKGRANDEKARAEAAESALAAVRTAFWECFTPDWRGADWEDDAAIQRFAIKASTHLATPTTIERSDG